MKHFLMILTNALPLLCAAALMFGGAALVAHRRMSDDTQARAAEARRLHQEVTKLNERLRTLEAPQP